MHPVPKAILIAMLAMLVMLRVLVARLAMEPSCWGTMVSYGFPKQTSSWGLVGRLVGFWAKIGVDSVLARR